MEQLIQVTVACIANYGLKIRSVMLRIFSCPDSLGRVDNFDVQDLIRI